MTEVGFVSALAVPQCLTASMPQASPVPWTQAPILSRSVIGCSITDKIRRPAVFLPEAFKNLAFPQ